MRGFFIGPGIDLLHSVALAVGVFAAYVVLLPTVITAQGLEVIDVEGQPLAANVSRLIDAWELLGTPQPADLKDQLRTAAQARDAVKLQKLLDPKVLLVVLINPESRVKVTRGPAPANLQQGGFTPVLVKVVNQSTVTKRLRIVSPQAGAVYSGESPFSLTRQGQLQLRSDESKSIEKPRANDRFLQVEMFASPPMTSNLSGLAVEYALALIYSSESGRREATIGFDIEQGNQDLGFRAEAPVLFDVRPATRVKLQIRDFDGKPTTARLTFRDALDHVYPPQVKRLAPDLFFQQQIYRVDGDVVFLPPGELTMESSRGPEYRLLNRKVTIPAPDEKNGGETTVEVKLERWVNPMDFGFYCGDHHIHAAGCAHYTNPTEGVFARDMFRQVKGEGLNVGCVLTWGPCYDFQRQFFSPTVDRLSEPLTLMKYDLEISGFGSQALGHVCLLNLIDQTYPGSDGTSNKGWPTWTTPVMRWTKQQGGVTGYAHSASGLHLDPPSAAKRLLSQLDADKNGRLSPDEAAKGLLPDAFNAIDADRDQSLTEAELTASINHVADQLPNLAIPEMNGVGAQEICVTVAQGLCDFISAMDSARIPEWNCWYHILNCGFPLKVSGETDFPCMSSTRVGQGRVYVQLGKIEQLEFGQWCDGLAKGRSYVSDGYAHALEFTVAGKSPGSQVEMTAAGEVTVKAKVAFGSQTPVAVPYGGIMPSGGNRLVGDTVNLHAPREGTSPGGNLRRVELVVNGLPKATVDVPADDQIHELSFNVPIERSSWVALRHFPELHTNPVNVIVGGKPIRASRASALWCIATIEQLWRVRGQKIAASERNEAEQTFQKAIDIYRKIAEE